jgi:3-oxoacyl-ACP reductase-like protein
MSSSPPLATAVPQLNTTREFPSISAAMVQQDVEALVDYIYTTPRLDINHVITFATVPRNGREIDGLDDKSELVLRFIDNTILNTETAGSSSNESERVVYFECKLLL